jgi:hypothetical protein
VLGVKIEITRFVDDYQPGIVECVLVDAQGSSHVFIEKMPVVTSQDLDANSAYPQAGVIACQVVERRVVNGHEVVRIDTTPWVIESTTGEVLFDVLAGQLIEIDQN